MDKRARKRPRIRKTMSEESSRVTYKLHKKHGIRASPIPPNDRKFFVDWMSSRNLDKQYLLLAMTYWMRIRLDLGVFLVVKKRELYMIACVHTSLKWLGYDEEYRCRFIDDYRQFHPITPKEHREIEFQVLEALGWEL